MFFELLDEAKQFAEEYFHFGQFATIIGSRVDATIIDAVHSHLFDFVLARVNGQWRSAGHWKKMLFSHRCDLCGHQFFSTDPGYETVKMPKRDGGGATVIVVSRKWCDECKLD